MKKYRLATIAHLLNCFTTLPILLVAFVLFGYTVIRNYQYNYSTMVDNQKNVLHSVSDHMSGIIDEATHAAQSMDFLYFSNSSTALVISRNAEKILSTLQQKTVLYEEAVGVYLYNTRQQRSYSTYFSTGSKLMDNLVSDYLIPPGNRRSTFLQPVIYDGHPCYFYIIQQRYGTMALLIDPSRNRSYRDLCSLSNGDLYFSHDTLEADSGRLIKTISPSYPLSLCFQISDLLLFTGLNVFQLIASGLLILLFIGVIFLFVYIQKSFLQPLLFLSSSFQKISEGNTSYRIRKNSKIYEFDQFYQGFDAMLDYLHEAEAEAFRQQSESDRAKMQYLQMQIRPHFYLNCLKTINFLAQIHEDEKIQSIVISLSDYFRYSFQDVNRLVSIREELNSVVSYVELCRSLYSEIRLDMDIQEDIWDVPCLPLSILTFVENCIKHREDTDQVLIRIFGFTDIDEHGDPCVRLCIQNTHCFTEEILDELNHTSISDFQYRSHRVGIANVRYRLWLLYHEHFELTFSNEDEMATVSLTIPVQLDDDAEKRLL